MKAFKTSRCTYHLREMAGVLLTCFETLSIAATTLRVASAWLSLIAKVFAAEPPHHRRFLQ